MFRCCSQWFSSLQKGSASWHFEGSVKSCEGRHLLDWGISPRWACRNDMATLVEMTRLALVAVALPALVEMASRSTLKEAPEPLNNVLEPLNNPRCFTNFFRNSPAVNGGCDSRSRVLGGIVPITRADLPLRAPAGAAVPRCGGTLPGAGRESRSPPRPTSAPSRREAN